MRLRDYLEQHPRAPLYVTAACVLLLIIVQLVVPRFVFIAALTLCPMLFLCWGAWLFVLRPKTSLFAKLRWPWALISIIVLVATTISISIFVVRTTEAFRVAEACLRSSKAVRAAIGEVTGFDLGFLGSFDIVTVGPNGDARFVGDIASGSGSKRGELILQRSAGRWMVTQLRIPPRSTSTSVELNQEELQCR